MICYERTGIKDGITAAKFGHDTVPSAPSHHPRSGLDVVNRSDRPDGIGEQDKTGTRQEGKLTGRVAHFS